MNIVEVEALPKSRLAALLEHLSRVEDPREPWRVAHPLPEVLLLVVCGTICDCDDYEAIADWGELRLDFLRQFLPFHNGVPGGRWLTLLMNRIDPATFQAAFTGWVRETWPDRPDLIAIDGKTSRRSHDRAAATGPLHLVSAFATSSRLVLGQEAVAEKAGEVTAIPALIDRLAAGKALDGAVVSIDAVATNPAIATAIRAAGADYLLAVKTNQPTLRAEVEAFFADAPASALDSHTDHDKGHGRIEQRTATVGHDVGWLTGDRRFPGELRLPDIRTVIRVATRTELRDRGRFETRYYVSSARLDAERANHLVRGHWAIENRLHWVMDVVFNDDLSRLRKGHGAKNMAVVRHFALNLVRAANDKKTLKRRRKFAGWSNDYLLSILQTSPR